MMKSCLTLALATLLSAGNLAPTMASSHRITIVDAAAGDPNFSTLVAAVVKAGLVDTLDGRRQFTVFAPTNTAFDTAAEAILGTGSTGIDLVNALSVYELTDILLFHVSPGRRLSGDVLGSERVRTMNKDFLFPSLQGGVPFINNAEIVVPDLQVDNGVIHVIDAVLLP